MRFSAFATVVVCIGTMSMAFAGSGLQTLVVDRIEVDRIVTVNNAHVAFYGVRLVEEAQDPELYRDARSYLQRSFNPPSFKLDVQEFREAGVARNRYGDIHGKILLTDGTWLQEQLVARGFGVWSGAPGYPPALRQRLVQAEKAAEIENLGIWRHFKIVNANRPARQYWNGQFIIAKGIVREVYRGGSATYLNFGEDWRNDFTVAISSRSRKKFGQGDWKIEDLKNRSVIVRGLVRFYNGPYLELDFPEQLEVSDTAGEG